ncbi:MAG: translocation/assembly module TamB domain-containing protein [Paracoccaceae bacterium]
MRILALILALLLPIAAQAQNALVAGLIEDSLSGPGRTVEVTEFSGALSARATIELLTISDDDGVWLRLEGAVLDWNRGALLRGRLEIQELSAASIVINRLPMTEPATPSPQASGFRIPDLPVTVDIAEFAIRDLQLMPDILGEMVTLSVTARASLDGGAAQLRFDADRTDGIDSRAMIDVSFDPDTKVLHAKLDISEPKNGLVVHALGLPDSPSLRLNVDGSGQLDSFSADVLLETDGDKRLSGDITLSGQSNDTRQFSADISGDIRPLLTADTRAFFGPRTALTAQGETLPNGGVDLSQLQITTDQARLKGAVRIDATGAPVFFDLDGALEGADRIRLPGTDVNVTGADLRLTFDGAVSSDWNLAAKVDSLDAGDVAVQSIALKGTGQLLPDAALPFSGLLQADMAGIQFTDLALSKAVGPTAHIKTKISASDSGEIRLDELDASTSTAQMSGNARFEPVDGRIRAVIETSLDVADLAPFSDIASPLHSGTLSAALTAETEMPGGDLSLTLTGTTQSLDIANAQIAPLIQPKTVLQVNVERDANGTRINQLTLNNPEVEFQAQGTLSDVDGSLTFDARLADARRITPELSGPITLQGRLDDPYSSRRVEVSLRSDLGVAANLAGTLSETNNAIDLDAQVSNLAQFIPTLSGSANLKLALSDIYSTRAINGRLETSFGLVADTSGTLGPDDGTLDFNARLNNIGQFATGLTGGMRLQGRLDTISSDPRITATIETDTGALANVSGPLSGGAISASGSLPLGLAGPFIGNRSISGIANFDVNITPDQQLNGLSGQISTQGARFSDPDLGVTISPFNTNVQLSNGRAAITSSGTLNGGSLSANGTVGLQDPFQTDLRLQLQQVTYRFEDVLSTQLYSDLALRGPASQKLTLSGALQLGKLEIRVPDTGLGGAETIPDITHLGIPARVRQTLNRAGLSKQSDTQSSDGPDVLLDVAITALDPIFVRGRGLDAEFGGGLRVTGSVANPNPVGQFELQRGRLSLLGQRLDLTEGTITAAGRLIPRLRIVAESQSDDVLARIILSGPADSPSLEFSSVPELPEDEILARLLFGRSSANLSPFQVASLISSLAQLAGKGGPGVLDNTRRQLGFDDLDFRTDETTGEAELAIGEYLTDNVYTEVELGAGGNTQINLNLDVGDATTIRGSADVFGNTSVGIFWEKDY